MATSSEETGGVFQAFQKKTLYQKIQTLLGEFGYKLSFPEDEDDKTANAVTLIIGSGYLIHDMNSKERNIINQKWFDQMGQYIYKVQSNDWEFDILY